ncbi:HNH endonuclease signature motif containing protein [Pectobacterium sp. CFBP8739]|uniref:HNH endonuclease signature motif containing protein n=1 Tax=Pectobacterium sp. CFBP8739 TaxID=2748908 RepID=UPI0015DFF067|nr:HNH endonuclease signature motif containing protein [Pectobacterium sp. CFBP8739]MBA0167839.1 HNH endonuclease [Pectobacterium sp. CFBP8739]
MSTLNPDIKKLYGLSAGRCNICKIDLFENNVHIGEMAHIIAKNFNGPRGKKSISTGRNSYDNLILLCANHHTEVDKNPTIYTVEKLQQIKYEHEGYVNSTLSFSNKERINDIYFINTYMKFVPFSRLNFYVDLIPHSVEMKITLFGDMFDALLLDLPTYYPLNDTSLAHYFSTFITNYNKLWGVISGDTQVDGRIYQNFSSNDSCSQIRMEKRNLPFQVVKDMSELLILRKNELLHSYYELINFLRSNYKEVDLDAFSHNM